MGLAAFFPSNDADVGMTFLEGCGRAGTEGAGDESVAETLEPEAERLSV
jgi:hypothetical protein